MMESARMLPLLIALAGASRPAAECPAVNAGRDTTVRVGYEFRMPGAATDPDSPAESLVFAWTLVAGTPGGFAFAAPDAARSLAYLKAPGVYVCELSVSDGACVARDSVEITVLDSIPFRVLRPQAGERIRRGTQYTVEWQIDPPAGVLVEFSPDGGDTFVRLTPNSINRTTYVWTVGADIPPGDSCMLRIVKYMERTYCADSPPFSVVDSSGAVAWRTTAARARAVCSGAQYTLRGQRLEQPRGRQQAGHLRTVSQRATR